VDEASWTPFNQGKRMTIPRIIGICGNVGSGKNAIAQILQAEFGHVIRGFSDPLYRILETLNPWIVNSTLVDHGPFIRYNQLVRMYGVDKVKRDCPEVRKYLRLLGSECARDIHGQDCWVKRMNLDMAQDKRTVIQGIRFKNEVDFVKYWQEGIMIHVRSDNETPPDPSHISESSINYMDVSDIHILNNDTLDTLRRCVMHEIKRL